MKDFEKAIKFLIEHETVYVKGYYGDLSHAVTENVKGDDGGLTKFGIDFRSHPDEDIANLTYARAVEIYKDEYWDKSHAEKLPWPLNLVQVDGAVNTGVGQQTKFLQRVVGVDDDGAFGPRTLAATLDAVNESSARLIALEVINMRQKFYKDLAFEKPEKEKFLDGWLNRLSDLRNIVSVA